MSPAATTFDGSFAFSPRSTRVREIPWREWSSDAFALARESDRPILLSLSASWSDAAHSMDESTYSTQEVIDLAASRFVSVRVDVTERPDVSARYGVAVPTTAFLTPEGDPIAVHGMLAPHDFVAEANAVLAAWTVDRDELTQRVEASRATRAAERATAWGMRGPGTLTPAILDTALEVLDVRWSDDPPLLDGGAPGGVERVSTLHPDVLRLWRYAYHRRGDARGFNRAFDLVREQSAGDLYDHDAGGFFRARAEDGQPRVKFARDQGAMLVALAELAISYEEAREELDGVIEETAAFLTDVLGDYSGGIRVGLVGAGTPMEDIDDRVIAGDAAVAARGLLIAGTLLGRSDWVERGRRAVDFLLTNLRAGEAGVYHAWDESVPRTLGILDDQAQVLLALMECYEVSGQGLYFEHARRIARVVERDWHEPGVGFMDLAAGHDETGLLAEPMFAMQANVDIAEALLWLGRLTHDERFLQLAQETLGMFARGIEARGVTVANYARVVDRLLSAEPEFKIVAEFPAGEPDSIADPLHRAALKLALAGRTVQRLDRVADIDLMRQLGLPDVAKVAYVCMGGTCSAALTAPDQLLPAIDELIEQPFL